MQRCPICGSGFEEAAMFCPFDGCSLVTSEQRGRLGGIKIDDRYFIERRIGAGGLGEVYHARHIKMGRAFALKILHHGSRDDETHAQRFDIEARVLSRLHHPYCVEVTDYGQSEHGPYIVMELVEGQPLSLFTKGEGMPLGRGIQLMIRVLQGLEHAHAQGIIHRDLKPDNIMLTTSPTDAQDTVVPKILDFGLAKLQPGYVESGDVNALTAPGKVVGTPAYLAPERVVAAQGGGGRVDQAVDLYAAGVILYELCCGRRPFVSDDLAAIVRHHLLSTPPQPRALWPELPEALEAVILCAMAKKPAERFADARAFREALEAVPLPEAIKNKIPPLAGSPQGSTTAPSKPAIFPNTPSPSAPSSSPASTPSTAAADQQSTRVVSTPLKPKSSKPLLVVIGVASLAIIALLVLLWNC